MLLRRLAAAAWERSSRRTCRCKPVMAMQWHNRCEAQVWTTSVWGQVYHAGVDAPLNIC